MKSHCKEWVIRRGEQLRAFLQPSEAFVRLEGTGDFKTATSNNRAPDQGDSYCTVLETFESFCLTILVVISLGARSVVSFPGAGSSPSASSTPMAGNKNRKLSVFSTSRLPSEVLWRGLAQTA